MKYVLIILLILAVICIISLIAGAKWIKIRNYYVSSDKLNNMQTKDLTNLSTKRNLEPILIN